MQLLHANHSPNERSQMSKRMDIDPFGNIEVSEEDLKRASEAVRNHLKRTPKDTFLEIFGVPEADRAIFRKLEESGGDVSTLTEDEIKRVVNEDSEAMAIVGDRSLEGLRETIDRVVARLSYEAEVRIEVYVADGHGCSIMCQSPATMALIIEELNDEYQCSFDQENKTRLRLYTFCIQ